LNAEDGNMQVPQNSEELYNELTEHIDAEMMQPQHRAGKSC